jgi:hypothetical protein
MALTTTNGTQITTAEHVYSEPIDITSMSTKAMYVGLDVPSEDIPIIAIYLDTDRSIVLHYELTESTFNTETREWDRRTLSVQTERVDSNIGMHELHDLAHELRRRAIAEAGS